MEIHNFLSTESVFSCLHVTSKKQLLQEISMHAAKICGKNEQTIFDILLERERLGTTGIGRGVAIPHGKLPGLDQLYGFFVKLKQPINFESIDNEAVDLIFLLLTPETAGAEHLKALAQISRMFRDAVMCKKLRASKDKRALCKLLL